MTADKTLPVVKAMKRIMEYNGVREADKFNDKVWLSLQNSISPEDRDTINRVYDAQGKKPIFTS